MFAIIQQSPVGGCDTYDDVVLVALKPIELCEQLIQSLLPLIVAAHSAAHVSALVAPHSITEHQTTSNSNLLFLRIGKYSHTIGNMRRSSSLPPILRRMSWPGKHLTAVEGIRQSTIQRRQTAN